MVHTLAAARLREGHPPPPQKNGESMRKKHFFFKHQFLVVVSKLLGFSGRVNNVNKPGRFGPKQECQGVPVVHLCKLCQISKYHL